MSIVRTKRPRWAPGLSQSTLTALPFAGQVDVVRQGFGVPSHGRQRVKTERPPAWQGETQQDEYISFLLDKRGGGRWGVGYSGFVLRDTVGLLGLP